MSSLIDCAETSFSNANVLNGFDIVGLDNSENIIKNTIDSESTANGNFGNLMEEETNFDFISDEIEQVESFDLNSSPLVEDADVELIESEEIAVEVSEQEAIDLEFFSDGANIVRENVEEDVIVDDIITKGWNEGLNNEDGYEIF